MHLLTDDYAINTLKFYKALSKQTLTIQTLTSAFGVRLTEKPGALPYFIRLSAGLVSPY